MARILAILLGLTLLAPHSALAFLGMNAGATLQGALPAWTKQLGARTAKKKTSSQSVAIDSSGNIFVAGYTSGELDGNTLTGSQDFFVTKYDSTGAKLWTRQLGVASKSTFANGVATDSSGNVFVAGYTNGGLDGNTLTGSRDFFVTKYDSTGAKIWTKQLGVSSSTAQANGVATDSSGNIFVAGYTTGGLDGNSLTGSKDFFVTKYDSTGAKVWTRQSGVSSKDTWAYGVATDSFGNIFVAGSTNGGLDGNTLAGSPDIFVTKYDSTGAKLWTKQLGVTPNSTSAYGVATDLAGNVLIAGSTTGGIDGNTRAGLQDFFVTKYDSTGAKIWTRQSGVSSSTAQANDVATDSAGNIFVAGYTYGGLDGNTLTGSQDFFVTKYDATGAKVWTRQLGVASKTTIANGVATDSAGNIFVASYSDGGLDGNTLTGSQDSFVTKYDSTGAKTWTKHLGGLGPTQVSNAVAAADLFGHFYVAGSTDGGLDGNTLTGTQDFFVTKYDSTGAKLWTRQLGVATGYTKASGVATDSAGNVFVAGYTYSGLDGNTLAGSIDFFVTKYDSSGAKIWTRQSGVSSKAAQANGVATDSSGNVLVAGYTTGGLDGNTLAGSQDFFVTKYDSSGAKIWTKQLGVATKSTSASGVATDSAGNIFVAGSTDSGLDGNTLTGTQDFFVTKYDPTGARIWTKQLGVATKSTSASGVATDSAGNIFVAGYTSGGLDGNTLKGTQDFFVTKYDSTGAKLWTRQLGVASMPTRASGVATDSAGNVFVAGFTTDGLDGNTPKGTQDFFVTKYTSLGVRQWTKQMGIPSKDVTAQGIAIDPMGRLYISGITTGGLDFNSLSGATDAFACQYIGN